MKKCLSLLLCILLLTGCANIYDGPVQKERVLSQKTSYHYYYLDEAYTTRERYDYDINGNLARVLSYNTQLLESEKLSWETRTRYDDQGRKTSETGIDHSGWFSHATQRESYTYDDQGRVLTHTYRDFWGRMTNETAYAYDGATEKRTYTSVNDGVTSVSSYTQFYNEAGLPEKLQAEDGDENRYFYDGRGNLTRREDWVEGKLYSTAQWEYDEQDRQICFTACDAYGALQIQLFYEYDDTNRTMTRTNSDGSKRVEQYDENGDLVTVTDYDSDGEPQMEEHYFYDYIEVPADKED